MPITQAPTQQPAWTNAIADNIQEFPLTPLSVISGAIPAGLQGTLYRNGPGRLQLGGEKACHWFDGDGAILAVHFTDSTPQATYRFVKTTAFVEESAAGEYLYTNYGIRKPDPIWRYWYKAFTNNLPVKNSGNTSVLALEDRLLALCEAGKPHALDLHNLTTFGEDDLGGLKPEQAYIAHPKRDPETGHIYSIGVTQDIPKNQLCFYHSDATGKILKQSAIEFDTIPFLHSFVMAGRYLVCLVPPIEMDRLFIALGIKTYNQAIKWNPDQGWVLTVVYDGDADTSEVWVFDSERLDQEPVCRLSLPQVIPIGFHGTWRPA